MDNLATGQRGWLNNTVIGGHVEQGRGHQCFANRPFAGSWQTILDAIGAGLGGGRTQIHKSHIHNI